MHSVTIHAGKCYEVLIGSGLTSALGERIRAVSGAKRAFLVSDDRVFSLYGEGVLKNLRDAGFLADSFVLAHGEGSKNLSVYEELLLSMNEFGMNRSDVVVALGGGVVGDLAGFAAATYRRGISFVQVPTTLLAAVDSSVGGKTAVNLQSGKNLVGCFYQPDLVVCDTDMLNTLPIEEYRNGCAEIIKYAMLSGEDLFSLIERTAVCSRYEEVIARCVEIKAQYVEADEYDRSARMLLNFGHTIGHAIEAVSEYRVPHGMAVGIGMAAVTRASVKFGYCTKELSERLQKLLSLYGIPVTIGLSEEALYKKAMLDKKNSSDTMRIIVPKKIGRCEVLEITKEAFTEWLREGLGHAEAR